MGNYSEVLGLSYSLSLSLFVSPFWGQRIVKINERDKKKKGFPFLLLPFSCKILIFSSFFLLNICFFSPPLPLL